MSPHDVRWQVEQVLALAPKPASISAAQPLAVPNRWAGAGCDDRAVWGRCTGSSAEPYECVVDHVGVASSCTCPSRVQPCKHALALLLLWARGLVPRGERPMHATAFIARRGRVDSVSPPSSVPGNDKPATTEKGVPERSEPVVTTGSASTTDHSADRDDRVQRMAAGLAELDRWIDDRMRTGLADPALAQYATWDALAARLIDAQVGGVANRVRRMAGVVGAHPQWHEQMLAELGSLHLLATAGRRLGDLPPGLADSVAAAVGWQVRQAQVMAGVPDTDHWLVMGRSDTREDRIEVRRVWLRGRASGRWAMVLSFAAYGQSLDATLDVGQQVEADVFRYPGALGLRVLVGRRLGESQSMQEAGLPRGASIAQACAEIGRAIAAEPWIERYPVFVDAAPARVGTRWVLTDSAGSLPIAADAPGIGTLLACSEGRPALVVAEWTALGLVPLSVHLADRSIDLGPTADPSFLAVGA